MSRPSTPAKSVHSAIALTDQEQDHLDRLESRFQIIRDAVEGVVRYFHTGLFLWGEGGTGKSFTVLDHLQRLKCSYKLHNSRLTGRGLVDELAAAPAKIHVIEDAETLLDDKKSFGVLRSALWANGPGAKLQPQQRRVTWTAYRTRVEFVFTGGLVVISNANLAETIPEVRAIKSRISVLGLDVTNEEILALMKKVCLDGYPYGELYLSPEQCMEVREYVISKMHALKRNLDIRLMINGFRDYLQHAEGHSQNHWHVLIDNRMTEQVTYQDRTARNAIHSQIALTIYQRKMSNAMKLKVWRNRTGLGQAAFYRALKR